MTVLAIDTCESFCSAALVLPEGRTVCKSENIGRGHAERLLPMIEELLVEADTKYDSLSRIAVITGPGTFTGLRIGLSVARGLALALGIPCIGIMSLAAIAAEIMAGKPDTVVHAVTNGRGGQVFYQSFQGIFSSGFPKALTEPVNVDLDIVEKAIKETPGIVGGSAATLVNRVDCLSEIVAVNPLYAAKLALKLCPEDFPPEPSYLRAADAAKAKVVFQVIP